MKYKLYVTINKLNGKLYGGKRYWTPGTSYMGSGLALKKAIEKYGKDNFEVRWFKLKINTPVDLERLEITLIRRLRYKFGKDRCYNMSNGGRGGCYGPRASTDKIEQVKILISEGKKRQYANGSTEEQRLGRIKQSKTLKKRLREDKELYKKIFVDGNLTRVNSLKTRIATHGKTDKEIDRQKELIKYSLVYVKYLLKYSNGVEVIEINTLQDFQLKYKTEDIIFSNIRKNGIYKFKRRISTTKHVFPIGTEIHYISEMRGIDVHEETGGSSVPPVSI